MEKVVKGIGTRSLRVRRMTVGASKYALKVGRGYNRRTSEKPQNANIATAGKSRDEYR